MQKLSEKQKQELVQIIVEKWDWFFAQFEDYPTEPASRQLVEEKLKNQPLK